jgi:hypothetical protein
MIGTGASGRSAVLRSNEESWTAERFCSFCDMLVSVFFLPTLIYSTTQSNGGVLDFRILDRSLLLFVLPLSPHIQILAPHSLAT